MKNTVNLHYLFRRCLGADYIHSGNSTDYAISRSGRRLYIFFEWSDGQEDWKNNLDFPARAYSTGGEPWSVHRGFLKVWKSVRHEILSLTEAIVSEYPTDEIICVGYSHGAALSGLCTEQMEFSYGQRLTISGFGFGCPKFIWGRLPDNVSARFSHFVPIRNIPDIVTYLPPGIFGFSHPSPILEIGEKGKYTPIGAHYPTAYLEETKRASLYSFGDTPVAFLKV